MKSLSHILLLFDLRFFFSRVESAARARQFEKIKQFNFLPKSKFRKSGKDGKPNVIMSLGFGFPPARPNNGAAKTQDAKSFIGWILEIMCFFSSYNSERKNRPTNSNGPKKKRISTPIPVGRAVVKPEPPPLFTSFPLPAS